VAVTLNDLRFAYTVNTGPGGSTAQPSPADSYGGFVSQTPWPNSTGESLFPAVPSDAATGSVQYRCVFLYNVSNADTWYAVKVFSSAQPTSGFVSLGVDPAGVVSRTSATAQAARPVASSVAPAGVSFSTPTTYDTGISVGDIGPNQGRAIWVRRQTGAVPTTTATATFSITASGRPTP